MFFFSSHNYNVIFLQLKVMLSQDEKELNEIANDPQRQPKRMDLFGSTVIKKKNGHKNGYRRYKRANYHWGRTSY